MQSISINALAANIYLTWRLVPVSFNMSLHYSAEPALALKISRIGHMEITGDGM